jgi:hypothetical protein
VVAPADILILLSFQLTKIAYQHRGEEITAPKEVNEKIGHVIYIRECESILQTGDGTRTTVEREKLI